MNTTPNTQLRYIVRWSFMEIIAPGINYIKAGKKKTGYFIMAFCSLFSLFVIALLGLFCFQNFSSIPTLKEIAVTIASSSDFLYVTSFIVPAIFVLMAIQFISGFALLYVTGRTFQWGQWKKTVAGLLAFFISVVLIAPGALGGYYSYTAYNTLKTVFSDSDNEATTEPPKTLPKAEQKDPWANTERVNVMLLGGDEGKGRIGVRPDIIMVASINTQTGRTELFNIPRNLRHVLFPSGAPGAKAFPKGFTYEEGLINSVWQWGDEHKDLFPQEKSAGITATQQAVEGALGINIDYRAYINMKGFEDFINGIGGITVNVPRDLPKAKEGVPVKSWVKKGNNQKLNGNDALWFVRSRAGSSDYDRMERTRCMIKGITAQSNPQKLVQKFPELSQALKNNFSMNIPQKDLSAWADLFERVQIGGIDGVALTNDVITPFNPDYKKLHELVKKSIGESVKESEENPDKKIKPDVTTPYIPTVTSSPTPTKTAKKHVTVDDKASEYC